MRMPATFCYPSCMMKTGNAPCTTFLDKKHLRRANHGSSQQLDTKSLPAGKVILRITSLSISLQLTPPSHADCTREGDCQQYPRIRKRKQHTKPNQTQEGNKRAGEEISCQHILASEKYLLAIHTHHCLHQVITISQVQLKANLPILKTCPMSKKLGWGHFGYICSSTKNLQNKHLLGALKAQKDDMILK